MWRKGVRSSSRQSLLCVSFFNCRSNKQVNFCIINLCYWNLDLCIERQICVRVYIVRANIIQTEIQPSINPLRCRLGKQSPSLSATLFPVERTKSVLLIWESIRYFIGAEILLLGAIVSGPWAAALSSWDIHTMHTVSWGSIFCKTELALSILVCLDHS